MSKRNLIRMQQKTRNSGFKRAVVISAVVAAMSLPSIACADLVTGVAVTDGVNVRKTTNRALTGQQVVLTENIMGALSAGTVVLELDNGVEFTSATVTEFGGPVITTVPAADSSGRLVITIDSNSPTTTAGKLTITDIIVNASGSSVALDTPVQMSLSSASTATGAAFSPVTIANVVAPAVTVANASGSTPTGAKGGTATLRDINITENVASAIKTDASGNDEIVVTLPTGWTFASDSNQSYTGTTTLAADNPDESSSNTMTLNVGTGTTTVAGKVVLGGATDMTVNIPSAAATGTYQATVAVRLADNTTSTSTVDIVTVANSGITATGVASTTDAWAASPTALTSTTRPKTPAGRANVTLGSVMIVENFADDLINDTLTITLPAGVTFASDPTLVQSNIENSASASAVGYSHKTVTVGAQPGSATKGGLLIGQSSTTKMVVNIADTVPVGTIDAVITGTVKGTAITSQTVTIGEVVAGGATIEANATIPVRGIGASGQAIGAFTITEELANSLLANSSTITATLPTGITWNAAPTATPTNITLSNNTATLSNSNRTATWSVSVASSTAATISVAGNIDIASTVAAGSIDATVAGTAGASGTVSVATAAVGTSTAVGSIPTLALTTPTQSVSTITITEAFAGALAASGKFRIVLPSGLTWSATVPTIATAASSGTKLVSTVANSFDDVDAGAANSWEFERGTTFASNDTLIVEVPNTASTGATTVTISGLKVNVAANATAGTVSASFVDGDLTASGGAGLEGSSQIVGHVGTPADLVADNAAVTVTVGGSASTVNISGGVGDLSITTASDDAVATATLANGVLTITPVAAGTTSVVISDSAATADTVTVSITVSEAAAEPARTTTTASGATTAATIAGGVSTDGGLTYVDAVTSADAVVISATITVDPADVDGSGLIHLVAGLDGAYFVRDDGNWAVWDGTIEGLGAERTVTSLAATETVTVWDGALPAAAYEVYVGYTNATGELIFNSAPITLTVTD